MLTYLPWDMSPGGPSLMSAGASPPRPWPGRGLRRPAWPPAGPCTPRAPAPRPRPRWWARRRSAAPAPGSRSRPRRLASRRAGAARRTRRRRRRRHRTSPGVVKDGDSSVVVAPDAALAHSRHSHDEMCEEEKKKGSLLLCGNLSHNLSLSLCAYLFFFYESSSAVSQLNVTSLLSLPSLQSLLCRVCVVSSFVAFPPPPLLLLPLVAPLQAFLSSSLLWRWWKRRRRGSKVGPLCACAKRRGTYFLTFVLLASVVRASTSKEGRGEKSFLRLLAVALMAS